MLVIRGNKLTLFPLRDETLESFWRDAEDVLASSYGFEASTIVELELSGLYLSNKMTDKLGPFLQQHASIQKISLQSCMATSELLEYFLRHIQSCCPRLECLESNGSLSDCWGPSTMQILEGIPLKSLRLLGMQFPAQQVMKDEEDDVEMANADDSSQQTRTSQPKPLHQQLQELDLTGCQWEQLEDSLLPLLCANQSLQKVSFKCCRLDDAKLAKVLHVLAQNHSKLHTIDLGVNQCGPRSMQVVAGLVESCAKTSLQFLDLSYQVVLLGNGKSVALDLEPLSQALISMATCSNNNQNSLTVLRLAGNQIRDDQLTCLANALAHDTCRLERLDLSNNVISNPGLAILSRGLATNVHLKSLNLRNNGFVDLSAFCMEPNVSLQHVQHSCRPHCAGSQLVEYVCQLNRGGRGLLRRNVPLGLWPKVLGKCCRQNNSDAIYYLLQQGQHR